MTCIIFKEGHKEEATLQNKMGGSEERCKPRRAWVGGSTTKMQTSRVANLKSYILATQSSTFCKPVVSAPPTNSSKDIITIKADTGATSTFIDAKDVGKLSIQAPTSMQPSIGALIHLDTSSNHRATRISQ